MSRDGIPFDGLSFGLWYVCRSLRRMYASAISLTGPFVALVRAGNKHSRPPSETGCINVTVYQPSSNGTGLPPPDKPTEQLELPVSMDGTFWKLCVRYGLHSILVRSSHLLVF